MEDGKPGDVDFSLFWDAWRVIQEQYVGQEPLNYEAMVHGAVKGMVESLGDPYTTFLDPKDTKLFLEDLSGSFGGVGMEIGMRESRLQIIAPLEGTPAEKAGLRAGDNILRIGEQFTNDMTIDEAVSLIRGPEGSKVMLLVLRDGWDEPREFDIERATITIPSLEWEFVEGDIAYVRLFQFSEKANQDFQRAANEILASSSQKVIIDVRNNPGGFLQVAIDIAAWFVDRGDIVVIEDSGDKGEREEHKARGNAAFRDHDVVVLINEGSASASEILAGALRDNNQVQLIGKKSFGKGSVQELETLKDQSSLKVTIANWLTPLGNLITGKGLEPDVEVELSDEDFEANRDPQLDKAIEVLKNL